MVDDRLEFGACDLELVCILYLVIFEVSGQPRLIKAKGTLT